MELTSLYFSAFKAASIIFWIAYGCLAGYSAIWIYRDAKTLPKLFLGSKPLWWSLACIVVGPIFVFIAYWLLHHSTISNRVNTSSDNS